MSVVLVSATQNFIIFMSDGRVQGESGGVKSILQENYKKLHRINQKLCVGYTGGKELCEQALKVIYNPYIPIISPDVDNISYLLCEESKNIFLKNNPYNQAISFIVGGFTAEGKVKFNTFGSKFKFKVEKYEPTNEGISYAGIYPDNANGNDLEKHLLANTPLNEDKIKKAMSDCIDEVADLDDSVNKVKFIEVIKRDNIWMY